MNAGDFDSLDLRNTIASLIRRHGDKWFRFVLRIVGNQQDAEDVVQEAVRRVLLRNRPFRTEEEARMYLSRAICNTAIESYHCRRRERVRCLPLKEQTLSASESVSPQAMLENQEESDQTERLTRLLKEGLAHLPTKQYEALYLTVLEPGAASIRDAGAERGIPYSTLRHRSVQGLRRLKKFIRRALRSAPLKVVMT
jgi:RNA polymerase sigma factor (sigma-70 family)